MARPKTPPSPGDGDKGGNPLKPKSRRLPADVRRARHRDRMQRQRLAEKKSIELKRVEVERLTRELEQAIKKLSSQLKSLREGDEGRGVEAFPSLEEEDTYLKLLEGAEEEEQDQDWKGQSTAARLIQQRYLSLVLQQETITEENRRLTDRFREWQRFMKLLGVEHERLPKYGDAARAIEVDELQQQEGGGEGRWVVFSEDEPVIYYQPLARDTCHELAFRGYQKMQEVLGGLGARKLYNEAFGWKVYFSMHEEGQFESRTVRMQHRFTKRISAVDANGQRITGTRLQVRRGISSGRPSCTRKCTGSP